MICPNCRIGELVAKQDEMGITYHCHFCECDIRHHPELVQQLHPEEAWPESAVECLSLKTLDMLKALRTSVELSDQLTDEAKRPLHNLLQIVGINFKRLCLEVQRDYPAQK